MQPQAATKRGRPTPRRAGALAVAVALTVVPALAEPSPPRERIELGAREREHMKAGMRAYLESIQGIVAGLARHDFRAVARAAGRSGKAAIKDVSPALALSLPPQFTLMSVDTHERFDALAKDALGLRTNLAVQKRLDDVLTNCTAYHAMYRF